MGKWDFLKKVGKTAGQAALQGAISSNPGIALAVQVAQSSINHGQPLTVDALNAILIPQGYMVVPLPTGFTPAPGQATVSTSP